MASAGSLTQQEKEQITRQAYDYAESFAARGLSHADLVGELIMRKIPTSIAETVAGRLVAERYEAQRAAAMNAIAMGAVICIIGLVITFATYSAASRGGTYIVTTGAIFGGGFQFFRGIYYYLTAG